MIDKEGIKSYLHQQVKLVKSDNFVISGRVIAVYPNCIEFFTDGRKQLISFEKINEIVPLRNKS